MDNCIANENVNNDFLSQSYAQGIERITGTKDSIFDFQIPKELLDVREKTWDNLFNKYSEEMSDDIEINVDTLEPEEEGEKEEEEETFSEEGYSCGHRGPMRKPAILVQYWINTGNPPYKMLLDENESSETDLSLSEKEMSPLMSLVTNSVRAVNNNDRRKSKNDSSCSSVDTAAYILSNVNITKKADTIAIMEGAKCTEVNSLKNIKVLFNNKIEHTEITRIDQEMRNDDDDVNVDVPSTELHSISKGYIASEINDGVAANTQVSADTIQSNMCFPCEDQIDKFNTSQRNLDVQTINDIASIFRQFDKTSKRLSGNDKNNDVLDQRDKALEMDTFGEKQNLENVSEIIAKDTSSMAFHRKKLYTGRDSPVDLILTETHSINRLSQTRQNPTLHPALDPDGTIKRKTFLIDKNKRKRFAKKRFISNRHETNNKNNVKHREVKILDQLPTNVCLEESRNVANTNIFPNKTNVSQNTNLQINRTLHPALDPDGTIKKKFLIGKNKRKRFVKKRFVSNRHKTNNKNNVKHREVKILDQLSTNVCLEESRNVANTNIFPNKTNVSQNTNLQINRTLHPALDPDGTIKKKTFLIGKNKRKRFAKKRFVSNRHETNNKNNVKLQEVKILEQLPTNVCLEESHNVANTNIFPNKTNVSQNTNLQINHPLHPALDPGGTIKRKTFLIGKNKRKHSAKKSFISKRHETNNKNNVELREVKILLERLSTNVCLEGSRNVVNTNIFPNKTNVSQNTNLQINRTSHPPLDSDGTIERKTFLIGKNKRKRSAKKSFISKRHETNNKNNVELREVKILLERLSTNVCLKGSCNVANTNIFPNKTNVSQNTNLQINDKRKSQICEISKILTHKNEAAVRPVGNNYSLRSTSSKKNNSQTSDTIDIITKTGSQVFDKVESDSTFQQKIFRHNCGKVSRDDNKSSVLTFTSSDEDDFVRSIHARKKLKVSINDDTLGKSSIAEKDLYDQSKFISDKNKYRCNRNSSMVICSSKKTVQKDIVSIKEKKKYSGVVKTKSFRSSRRAATATSQVQKNERFEFFASENDNDDDAADNSNKRKERISFFNAEKNINYNSKRRSKRMMKKNGINHKDDIHIILFQTKTFDANSSEFSEESSSYTSPTCKALKSSSFHNRLRYKHNRVASKAILNDSIAKRRSKRHLSSSNSSLENHNWMKSTNDVRTRTRSVYKEVETNKRLTNGKPNGDFKSRNDEYSSYLTSDVRDTSIQEETFSNTCLKKINFSILPENKEILDKCKNSVVIQQDGVTSTVRRLLTFQTKSYYNSSDSSETS